MDSLKIKILQQSFWYICCSISNKSSHIDYDEVYQCDGARGTPRSAANNNIESEPKHISRINKGKQIIKPVNRTLFSLRDFDSSEDEEDEMPLATTIFTRLSGNRVSAIVTSSSEEDNVPPSNK
ncbi:hypothetical protein Adt_14066 [Abeliophyllum distichum]|uniref:Uncharacterized protein n=1 Tax=Abeliophyllum distichum TaxID=126358 RepID=A0ABD1TYL1_9LAMI